jgi:hypothetical protein
MKGRGIGILNMVEENSLPSKRVGLRVLAVVLWVVTSVLGFLEILIVREIVLRIYAHFAATGGFYERAYGGGVVLGVGAAMAMGVVCVGIIIGGGEYHLRNFGQPQSWKFFGWTISAELSILLLALFV